MDFEIKNGVLKRYHGFDKDVVIPGNVTSIGKEAFHGCSLLTCVTVRNGVTSIGEHAFSNCSSLEKINIPDSVTSIERCAFTNCRSLSSVTIGNSVTSIGDGAFSECHSLTSIVIPNSVTSIGADAFRGTSLTGIVIPNSVKSIGCCAFYGCTHLIQTENRVQYVDRWVINCDNSLTSVSLRGNTVGICTYAFACCRSLASVFLPNGLKNIGVGAFRDTLLTNITIPDSVTSIGGNAFEGCTHLIQTENGVRYVDRWIIDCDKSLTSVSLRGNTVGIADYAFRGTSFTSIAIPDGVKSIGANAFEACHSLISIEIPNSVTSIGDFAFINCISLTHITIGVSISCFKANVVGLRNVFPVKKLAITVTLLSGVTDVGEAFFGCQWLKEITIPATVERVNARAFYGCEGLTELTIEEGVKYISEFAFAGCASLKEVVFPDSVEAIEESAFVDCKNLKKVSIPWNCAFDKTSFPKHCKVKRRK